MSKSKSLLDIILRFLLALAIFFCVLGIAAFIAWIRLLISGEYTSMINEIGLVTGKAVTSIGLLVAIGFTIIRTFARYKSRPEQEQTLETKPLPYGQSEAEYIEGLRKKKGQLSLHDIDRIKSEHGHYLRLKGEMLNWRKFWTECKHYRNPAFSRNKIKRMEREESPSPTVIGDTISLTT